MGGGAGAGAKMTHMDVLNSALLKRREALTGKKAGKKAGGGVAGSKRKRGAGAMSIDQRLAAGRASAKKQRALASAQRAFPLKRGTPVAKLLAQASARKVAEEAEAAAAAATADECKNLSFSSDSSDGSNVSNFSWE